MGGRMVGSDDDFAHGAVDEVLVRIGTCGYTILVRRRMAGYGMNAALLPDGMTGSVIED